MTDQDVDTAPEAGGDSGDTKSPRKPFTKLAVELTDEDLKSAGVQKLLLAEISRLEHYSSKYDECRDQLSTSKQKCAVFEERQKSHTFLEILYSAGLAIGAGLIGLVPSVKESNFSPLVVLGLGVVLMLVAVIAKVKQK